MVHITLTTARPNPNDLFRGSTTPQFQATIACRLLMPFEMAEQLTRTLVDALIKAKQAPRPTPETEAVASRTGKSDNIADRVFSDNPRLRS